MLRAALIGFGQTGKTTLFQLMTSAREAARAAHGKGEATIGISKVPDPRLDRLTAMYNPRKRVPATIEFSDLAARAASRALVMSWKRVVLPVWPNPMSAARSMESAPHPNMRE